MNQWLKYSQMYNCSIAEAIRDRDFPLTDIECSAEFRRTTGRLPTSDELYSMLPDSFTRILMDGQIVLSREIEEKLKIEGKI